MATDRHRLQQAATGLEQLAALARAQSWRSAQAPALPPTQAAVLRMLGGTATGLRARDIAARLGISAASLSDTLKALEQRGWIARTADPRDARASLVRLARAGRAVVRRLSDPAHGMASLLDGMHEADLAALLRATQWMVMQAQQRGWASGLRTCLGCSHFRPYAGEGDRPHFCDFIGSAFGDADLRMDCAEHCAADDPHLAASLERFRHPFPPQAEPADGARQPSGAVHSPSHPSTSKQEE